MTDLHLKHREDVKETVSNTLNQLWEDGLKDVWKIPEVNNAAKRIVSLDDIEQQKNRPWNNQDIQLYSERK